MTSDSKTRQQKKMGIGFVLAFCTFGFCASANSFSPSDPVLDKYVRGIETQIKNNWFASGRLAKEVIVSFDIVDDGTIYNPRFSQQSGMSQLDGECMAAVCLSSPLESLPIQLQTGQSMSLKISFKPSEKPAQIVSELRKFSQGLDLSADYFAYFKCPPAALVRYPGLINEKELFVPSNLRKTNVAEGIYTSHVWSKFVQQHQKAKKEEILNAFK